MKIVGHHLQMEAVKRSDVLEKDLFGRSSYNRYYYATFLCVRQLLINLDDKKWKKLAHKSYPEVLKNSVISELKRGLRRAQRIDDKELARKCSLAIRSANELSEIMSKGYATRVVADYHPDIRIDFLVQGRFELNSIDITDAHDWPSRASLFAQHIFVAWRQIHA